jgi:hypothetical protein
MMAKTATKPTPKPVFAATTNSWKRHRRKQKQRTALWCRTAVIILAVVYIIVLFYLRGSTIEVEGYQIRFGGGALSFFDGEDKKEAITDTDTDIYDDTDTEENASVGNDGK